MKGSILSLSFLCVLFFAFCSVSQAQINNTSSPKSDFWSKVRYGGGLGLSFGRNNTQITLSPSALYQPNQYVAFGPGLNFSYQKFDDLKTTLYGVSGIVVVNPIDFLQLSGEIEQLRVNQSIDGFGDIDPFWNTALFIGAGYRINIAGNNLGAVGIRYNLLFDEGSDQIYADAWVPFVRVYF